MFNYREITFSSKIKEQNKFDIGIQVDLDETSLKCVPSFPQIFDKLTNIKIKVEKSCQTSYEF